jgi:hypothetical protein
VFWALLIHVAIAILAMGLIYLLGSGDGALNEATKTAYESRPSELADVRSEALWGLALWTLLALAADWAIAGLWIMLAERQRPATPAQGAELRGLWAGLLIVSLIVTAVIGWRFVWQQSLQLDLATRLLTGSTLVASLATLAAYWTSTAVCVKRVMRRSVPLENVFPSIGGRA